MYMYVYMARLLKLLVAKRGRGAGNHIFSKLYIHIYMLYI